MDAGGLSAMHDVMQSKDGSELGQAITVTITAVLPPALLVLFPAAPREVAIQAATVGEAVAALDARFPGMGDRLCDTRPAIRRHINIVVEGRRASLDTPLTDGARVHVLTAISGG